jgi:hypothetical protein
MGQLQTADGHAAFFEMGIEAVEDALDTEDVR